ncbi:MAG: Dolichol-p-glucose synthetase, (Glycosyltransferase), partial [uncultured bacterium]
KGAIPQNIRSASSESNAHRGLSNDHNLDSNCCYGVIRIIIYIKNNMKLSIVVPCLDEVDTIERTVQSAYKAAIKFFKKDFEIIVADNGSTDGTLRKLAGIKNIKLINVPIRGYGAALHYGILSAKYPYVLFADADLSYDFMELSKFISGMEKNYDLILGSRIKGKIEKGAMPILHRYFGTPFLTFLIRILYGIKTSDCNSGMRAVRKSFYQILKMKNSGMEWASELLIKTAINKGKYIEVPINFYRDKRGKRPHLHRWEDGWRHLKVVILLKPITLLSAAIFFLLTGIILVRMSLFTTLSMFLLAEFLVLSFLAAIKLETAIQKKTNKMNEWLEKMPIVLMATIMSSVGLLLLFLISDYHLFTKYILLFQIVLFDLWVFFIETIKTHLVNPLPEKI